MLVGYPTRDKCPHILPDDSIGASPASELGTDSTVVYIADVKHGMLPAAHQPQISVTRGFC